MRKRGCLISTIIILIGFATLMTSCIIIKTDNDNLIDNAEALPIVAIALFVVGFIWAFFAFFQQKDDMEIDAKIKLDEVREEMQGELDRHENWLAERFSIDKHIHCHADGYLLSVAVDSSNRILIVDQLEIPFSGIVEAELITSESHTGTTTIQKNNGIGRAVVGGIIAGGVGAIVGAATAKESGTTRTHSITKIEGVYIYLSDVVNPMITLRGDETFNRDVFATVQAIASQKRR